MPLKIVDLDTYMFIHICLLKQMKEYRRGGPSILFKALSDPTRLRLLNLLAGGDTCVCELTDTLGVVQPKVSRHLARLKRAGLVDARRNGKWIHYRWAQHGDPLVRHVLAGLREWMTKSQAMNGERRRRNKVCCRISRRKPKGNYENK
jgi:ArsR family transcriptional regulator, arsenate/arsenite/antimonite-responsive transcriptional repressor